MGEQPQASRPGIRPLFIVAIVVVAVIAVFLLARRGDKKPAKPSVPAPAAKTDYTRPGDDSPGEIATPESPPPDQEGEVDENDVVYDDPSVPRKTVDVDTIKEQQANRDPDENAPTPQESVALSDRVLTRLQGELAAARQAGDADQAHRLEVRIQRLERQRAEQLEREAEAGAPGDAGPAE